MASPKGRSPGMPQIDLCYLRTIKITEFSVYKYYLPGYAPEFLLISHQNVKIKTFLLGFGS